MCHVFAGTYTRTNLNLPRVMVKRKNYKDFQRDSPLTEMGRHQARLTGELTVVTLVVVRGQLQGLPTWLFWVGVGVCECVCVCVCCLLYTSPSPRDDNRSRMPSSA